VFRAFDYAEELLDDLRGPVREAYGMVKAPEGCAEAFEEDVERWLSEGLGSPPKFDRTLEAYRAPDDGAPTFFVGPVVAPNGPSPRGSFLECFVAYREEPPELQRISATMPLPKNSCQSGRLFAGSRGFMSGNCIAFFPENVATEEKVESQDSALYFFNKFQRIYLAQTLPKAKRLFGDRGWASEGLSAEECYRARCIWGYLHDYFNHLGPWPLRKDPEAKTNFFAGLLEEVKVDSQSAMVAYGGVRVPFGREVFEFVLFERIFRSPAQPDAPTNFDAGTGLLLFEYLLRHGRGLTESAAGLELDLEGCVEGMTALVEEIELLEAQAFDDAGYEAAAEEYVRGFLPEGAEGARFAVPETYARLVGVSEMEEPVLSFGDLPY
jgi:hypothetical protein